MDLAGWFIADDVRDSMARLEIEEGTIEPGGFFVFGIGCGGDDIFVIDAQGVVLDTVVVDSPGPLATWGRLPDADGPWMSTQPTRDAPNAALPMMEP